MSLLRVVTGTPSSFVAFAFTLGAALAGGMVGEPGEGRVWRPLARLAGARVDAAEERSC